MEKKAQGRIQVAIIVLQVSSEAEEMGDVTDPLQSSTSDSKREMAPDELNSMKVSYLNFLHYFLCCLRNDLCRP